MAEEQADNLEEQVLGTGDSSPGDLPAEDFFAALDRQVNKGILDDSAMEAQEQTTSQEQTANTVDESAVEEHDWQKRYADSSSEAQRINSRLKELEPYAPILDAMKEDPNLITHVRGYFEGGGSTPSSLKEKLELDEDFIFDADEAVRNPKSDSSKVLGATIDGIVQKRLGDFATKQRAESQKTDDRSAFMERHELSSEQMTDITEFAKSRALSLDDIYYLYNREGRERNIAQSAKNEMVNQMKNVRQKPISAASSGSMDVEISADDQVFDTLLKAGDVEELLTA